MIFGLVARSLRALPGRHSGRDAKARQNKALQYEPNNQKCNQHRPFGHFDAPKRILGHPVQYTIPYKIDARY